MDVACYHSVGVNTALLLHVTTLNKTLLLDWPVSLCSFVGLTAATQVSVSEFLKKHVTGFKGRQPQTESA